MSDRAPPAALHLHLDVAGGVRADALLGALCAALPGGGRLDAVQGAVQSALAALCGPGAQLVLERRKVHGVQATRARIELPFLEGGHADAELARPVAEPRRRARAFVRDQRRARALAPVAEAQAPPPDVSTDGPRPRKRAAPRVARAPGPLERFGAGERARPAELLVIVRESALAPVTKALALRTCATLVESLGRVRGDVDEPVLEGAFTLRALAHVAAACAIVDAAAPALVTSSVVGVSSRAALADGLEGGAAFAPSAWLASVLEGAWLVERDDVPASDVVGAALVRTLASRTGARGLFAPLRQGFGVAAAGAADADADVPLLVRASTGRAAPLGSRAGEVRHAVGVRVGASVDLGADRDALSRALFEAGALEVAAHEARDLGGAMRLVVEVTGGPGAGEPIARALLRAGGERVATSWVELRAPAAVDVTVPVGRGRTKATVRVRVARDEEGEVLSARCHADDVREAARSTRQPEDVVRAEALQQWRAHAPASPDAHESAAQDEGEDA